MASFSLEQPKFMPRGAIRRGITRNVLIVGKTGSGVSTVANHILGVGRHVFSVSDVTKETTKMTTKFYHKDDHYYVNVINTIGFYGLLSDKDVIKSIKKTVNECLDGGLHLIIFVVREGEPVLPNKSIQDIYTHFGSSIDPVSCLVITGCENKDKDRVVMKYIKEPIAEHMKKGIIAVGFPDMHDYLTLSEVREDEMNLRDVICCSANSDYMHPKSKLFDSYSCVLQ